MVERHDKDRDRLDEWIARRYGNGIEKTKPRKAKKVGGHTEEAFIDGIIQGQDVRLHRAMNGGRKQEMLQ